MFDFLMISTKPITIRRRDYVEIYPTFLVKKTSDLMIRGGDFYAIWCEDKGQWVTDEDEAIKMIDHELDKYYQENKDKFDCPVKVSHLWDADTGMIDKWHKYCQKQKRDCFHMLDEKLIFSNNVPKRSDYSSKHLNYPLEDGECPAYDKLISTLYTEEERHKLEWAIGSIVNGDSKKLQKFIVLYGAAGTGKSTILNIIQNLFDGYYSVFDAKALGSANAQFALEPFKTNPLVAIQHDGDLSKIEDNTRINSLVSHEKMTVNEKFKASYTNDFKAFLFMGTNKPVKITDAKSGLLRRLIDVTPSGDKIKTSEYKKLVHQTNFELGAIAYHCKKVYEEDPGYYDDYVPISMMSASNDFYNFVLDSYLVFKKENGVTLKTAYDMYKAYAEETNVPHPMSRMIFKEELKNYFESYEERTYKDGTRIRNYYSGFKYDKITGTEDKEKPKKSKSKSYKFVFEEQKSILDEIFKDCPAQYAEADKPQFKWKNVKTTLKDLDTSKMHYVKPPDSKYIFIDFDLKDENGNKSFEKNLEAAEKWPLTYAELSKSGCGIHLYYYYTGDPSKLARLYSEDIEIKVCTGDSSIRRMVTKCNNADIANIGSGLPLKEEKVISADTIKSEKSLRNLIARNLNKEIHPGTKPSIDFIFKILEDAYDSGLKYDVSDMENAITAFAAQSSHNPDYCLKMVNKMKFKSKEDIPNISDMSFSLKEKPIAFYDVEVFPNLFICNYKIRGEQNTVVRLINPTANDIIFMIENFRLVGFNCRRYDNHIIYARAYLGYSNFELYQLSQNIINKKENCFFGAAYNLSWTDIYDFASAGNKKSLKKLEIEMKIHHKELGLKWDEPVPEELWILVAEYCDNDVIATEKAFDYLKADFVARQILAGITGMTVNDTTNTLTTSLIFGKEKKPQNQFHYRDLSKPVTVMDEDTYQFLAEACPEMMSKTHGEAGSLLPYWEGYIYKAGKSWYRDEEVGEGGYVYAEPGMYTNVALLDIASMHPHSGIAECIFGVVYSKAYRELVEGRVSIKHEAWEEVNKMLDGKLSPYIAMVQNGEITSKDLANALKTAINAVYGLTAAKFANPFRDPRNVDNIVAKRGALFMIDLKHEVQKRGFTVAHIKTDSIKIPDATPEIIQFVMDFGKRYGYTFEHEETYSKMCLVNDAVYIAKYKEPHKDKETGKEIWWTATGKEFAVPYVFKKLFSKDKIEFDDLCETFAVSKGDLYLDKNENLPQLSIEEYKELEYLKDATKECNDDKMRRYLKRYGVPTVEMAFKRYEELCKQEDDSHNYVFVGRVGQFTPVKIGLGGGGLYRCQDGKYYNAAGASGYLWVESEEIRQNENNMELVNLDYYNNLVNEAAQHMAAYGDLEWFLSDDENAKRFEEDVA